MIFAIFLSPNKLERNYNKLQTENKCSEWKDMLLKALNARRGIFQDRSRVDEELMTPHWVCVCRHSCTRVAECSRHSIRGVHQSRDWSAHTLLSLGTSGLARFFNGQNQFIRFLKINKRQPKYCKSTMGKTQKEEKWNVYSNQIDFF